MTRKLIAGGALTGLVLAGGIAGLVSAQTVAGATGLTESQVIEIALMEAPGKVTEVERERKDGQQVFEAGGDDYLTKPFAFAELSARVGALERRREGGDPAAPAPTTLRYADLTLDLLSRKCVRRGQPIDLMAKEIKLLEYLMRRPGRLVTRTQDDLDDMSHNLDRTAADLERLVSQTRHLSASIAHDLPTLLARLRAQLEMLPDAQGRDAALQEASHLSDIFDTLMRVARIEASQGRDSFEPVALDALAQDLAETFGPVVEDGGKTLHLAVGRAKTVQADRAMLVQAAANLIQNALVHGGDRITLFAEGGSLGVADNGLGVDPAEFDEIIKPMVRLDHARSTQGSGLGLALVRAVADRHGAGLHMAVNDPTGLKVTLQFV